MFIISKSSLHTYFSYIKLFNKSLVNMKTNFITFAAVAIFSLTTSVLANPVSMAPEDGHIDCDTTGRSPGLSNVALAAEELREKGGTCGKGGKTEQMVKRGLSVLACALNIANLANTDGVRIYAMGSEGSASCQHVAEVMSAMIGKCAMSINGDIRVGGNGFFNNVGTYVNLSQ